MDKQTYWRLITVGCSAFFSLYSANVPAQNLLQVFQDALYNDPTFRQAEAQWQSTRQQLPIALAALLPQIDATANLNENHLHRNVSGTVVAKGTFSTEAYGISLQQPIFNATLWEQLRGANDTVKSATATYTAAFQNLVVRTTAAYLSVLQAYDVLRYTLANKRATDRQLIASEQKFKVGLVAITEVYDAKSQYDAIVAQEIVARNQLDDTLEQLQAITGHYYTTLAGLSDRGVPLFPPQPADINAWVEVARRQNYSLVAQQYATKAAYDNVKANAAGHLPTVALQSSYNKQISNDQPVGINSTSFSPTVTSDVNEEDATVGLAVNMPVFSGGGVVANTTQARYEYANAAATLELTHRQVVSQTRQSYLGVISDISQIQADVQAIISASNAVSSTEEGYKVGTRTMVDVLNDLTRLYQSQQQLADDQYSYINNFVALKNQAGTLSIDDVRKIDDWLNQVIPFSGEYAPTRVRMAQGTFSYDFSEHDDQPTVTQRIPQTKVDTSLNTISSSSATNNSGAGVGSNIAPIYNPKDTLIQQQQLTVTPSSSIKKITPNTGAGTRNQSTYPAVPKSLIQSPNQPASQNSQPQSSAAGIPPVAAIPAASLLSATPTVPVTTLTQTNKNDTATTTTNNRTNTIAQTAAQPPAPIPLPKITEQQAKIPSNTTYIAATKTATTTTATTAQTEIKPKITQPKLPAAILPAPALESKQAATKPNTVAQSKPATQQTQTTAASNTTNKPVIAQSPVSAIPKPVVAKQLPSSAPSLPTPKITEQQAQQSTPASVAQIPKPSTAPEAEVKTKIAQPKLPAAILPAPALESKQAAAKLSTVAQVKPATQQTTATTTTTNKPVIAQSPAIPKPVMTRELQPSAPSLPTPKITEQQAQQSTPASVAQLPKPATAQDALPHATTTMAMPKPQATQTVAVTIPSPHTTAPNLATQDSTAAAAPAAAIKSQQQQMPTPQSTQTKTALPGPATTASQQPTTTSIASTQIALHQSPAALPRPEITESN